MTTYRDEGIVLRTMRLGEADRIVTLMTRGRGKVRGRGPGARAKVRSEVQGCGPRDRGPTISAARRDKAGDRGAGPAEGPGGQGRVSERT